MNFRTALILAATLVAPVGRAFAAMPPIVVRGASVPVLPRAEVALAFAQDGWEHLVVQPAYAVDGASGPPRVVWLIAVPAPATCAVAGDSVLAATWRWIGGISARGEPGVDEDPRVSASDYPFAVPVDGRYEATVIAPGADGRGLSAWLRANGCGALPDSVIRASVKAGWTVVALSVRARMRNGRLPTSGALRPIRISFRSDHIVYPVRLGCAGSPFPAILFVASAEPIHADDARTFGFVPLAVEECRPRLDRILWQAGTKESDRARIWYASADGMAQAESGPLGAIGWLAGLLPAWRAEVVNRRTAFPVITAREDGLGALLRADIAENAGNAPQTVVSAYEGMLAPEATRRDSLYVSAFCAPALGMRGTETDLARWNADPAIRFRDLVTPLPPLPAPYPAMAAGETAWQPPRPESLPPSEAFSASVATMMNAGSHDELVRGALRLLVEEPAMMRVRFLRQLRMAGHLDAALARIGGIRDYAWPGESDLPADARSEQAYERAFLRLTTPLKAAWIAAQHGDVPANPLVAAIRLRVAPDGTVAVVAVRSNASPGMTDRLLARIAEIGIRMSRAAAEETRDFIVVIEG